MTDFGSIRLFKILSRFSKGVSGVAIGFGALVLAGWALHIQRLKGFIPGQVAVKANTAVCFVLIGLALWLALSGVRKRFRRMLAIALSLIASFVGLLSFLEYWKDWDFGIDQLLFKAGVEDLPGSVRLGLMSPIAAVDFFLLGIAAALFYLETRWARVLQTWLATGAAAVSMFGLLDFVLDPHNTHTHIAPLTALVLFLISFAVLCARAQGGLGALLASATMGGLLCRRLLPSSILIPIGIAWLRWRGQQVGFYSDWSGLAIMTVSAGGLLAGLTVWTAVVLDRLEAVREQAEESARQLASIVTSSTDGIIGETLDGIVTTWNPGAEALYGYSAQEMIGQPLLRLIPSDLRGEFEDFLLRLRRGQSIGTYETQRTRKDGRRISVSITVSPLRDAKGTIIGAATTSRDITDRKQAERKLWRMNQTLQALSACTDSMMRATDESAMLRQVCEAIIRVGEYRMAWVGYAEQDPSKTVRPIAHAGMESDYLLTAQISWADVERGHGPTGIAVRTGKTVASRDFAEDPRMDPWQNEAARCGFRSSIALPLRTEDQILGAITIYSAEVGGFDRREQQLLEQLAANLSYAIMTLQARAQRDRSEQKLRESALYVRSLVEASLDPLVTINKQGKITDVNEATEKATGISRDRLIGSDFCDYFTEPQRAREGYQRVFDQGFVRDYPLAIRGTSGAVIDVLYNATLFKGADGKVEGVFAAARDITERKQAEEALHRSESRYRSLVTATAQIVWTTNREGEVVDDIPMWRDYTGMNPMQIAGTGWLDSLHPDDRSRTEMVWGKAWRNRERYETEYRIRRQDGEYRSFSVRGVPVLQDDGTVREWVGTCTDITERKQAEEEIRKLNEELEQRVIQRTAELEAANKELEAFTYSVSHDLRAPLRHISGFSKLLSEEFSASLPPEAQHHVQRIVDGTRRMGQLVDDLLNLGRVGRKGLSLQLAGLRAIVDDVIHGLNPEIGDREVEWKIQDLPYLECDTALMRQVLQNLLSNALKFTRPRSHAVIEIGQEQRDGQKVVFVRDNGVGFSMKYVDKLFGVFQRLHRAEDFEGTGVGLATVQRIIQKHGGRIWAEGQIDKGAAFYFTIGAAETEGPALKTAGAGAGT